MDIWSNSKHLSQDFTQKVMEKFRNRIGLVRFEVLTAASIKMTVFWVVAPYSVVEVYRRFRGACCLHNYRPVDDGDYTAQHPSRQPSSESE
jgi:hypothetical protein